MFESPKSKFAENLKKILFGLDNDYSKNNPYIFSMLILFFAVIHRRIGGDILYKFFKSFQENQKMTFRLKLNEYLETFQNKSTDERIQIFLDFYLNLT